MAGIFGNMNPKTGLALQGLGLGLAQLDAGRTPNLSPIYAQLQEQDQRAQMQEAIGPALEGMNPGMRKVLAAMPPALASQYIMKMMEPKEAPKPNNRFIPGIGVVDMNNPPETVLAGSYETPGGGVNVGAQEILADGTVIQSTDAGTRVFGPDGTELHGQAAADAVKAAQAFNVQNQQEIYAGRETGKLSTQADLGTAAAAASEAGKQAIDFSGKAYESAGALSSANSTIDRAIAALDNGAKAGVLDRYIPNVTQASAELRNAMDQMGLDVIQATTFGALSEGEMRLAMETAVPRNLDEPALRKWLEEKAAANAKAHAMLMDAAVFLGTPGNTVADWVQQNKLRFTTEPPAGFKNSSAPNFSEMSDDELEAWIAENGG